MAYEKYQDYIANFILRIKKGRYFMKMGTVLLENGTQCIGVLTDSDQKVVLLLESASKMDGVPSLHFNDILAFLKGGVEAREKAHSVIKYVQDNHITETTVELGKVKLLSPLPRPESIRDCMSFEMHSINTIRVVGMKKLAGVDIFIEKLFGRNRSIAYRFNKTFYERPIYYKGNRFSVVGHDAEVRIPPYTEQFDYELEWGIFIGKEGRDIPKEKAGEFIGGYTIFNDFSARDIQMREQGGRLGPTKGKDFDTGNAIGPFLVTPDEIQEPYNLTMVARVNTEEWSRGTTGDMYWRFEDIIEYISQSETLYPGDFIGSGTCSGPYGCGCGLEMGKFLKEGDVVELEVEGLGILKNRLIKS